MTMLYKAIIYITSILIGIVVGLWFVGAFLDHQITIDGMPISSIDSDEITRRVVANPNSLQSTTTLVLSGEGVFTSDGPWLMYAAMLLSTIIFGVAGHILAQRIGMRRQEKIS